MPATADMSSRYRILQSASHRIDEIYQYTHDNWGQAQARSYIQELFDTFDAISHQSVLWRKIPAAYGVNGYYTQYERHFIYWKTLQNGDVGIATILHERMNRGDRLAEDWTK